MRTTLGRATDTTATPRARTVDGSLNRCSVDDSWSTRVTRSSSCRKESEPGGAQFLTDFKPLVVEIYRNLPETRLDWAA
ncbi:hypothetical protein GCM10027448_39210 [Nocardioides dilutus]